MKPKWGVVHVTRQIEFGLCKRIFRGDEMNEGLEELADMVSSVNLWLGRAEANVSGMRRRMD
jgi:hypothetical protein